MKSLWISNLDNRCDVLAANWALGRECTWWSAFVVNNVEISIDIIKCPWIHVVPLLVTGHTVITMTARDKHTLCNIFHACSAHSNSPLWLHNWFIFSLVHVVFKILFEFGKPVKFQEIIGQFVFCIANAIEKCFHTDFVTVKRSCCRQDSVVLDLFKTKTTNYELNSTKYVIQNTCFINAWSICHVVQYPYKIYSKTYLPFFTNRTGTFSTAASNDSLDFVEKLFFL